MKDEFLSISALVIAELREKASKFIGVLTPLQTEAEAEDFRLSLWKEHPKASHVCYAYRLGLNGETYKINDDGEPSGTAGKPIYNQLQSYNLTDIGLYVIRYFGGTKLGTSGLITAYKDTSKLVIEEAEIIIRTVRQVYQLKFDYEHMGKIMDVVKNMDFIILDKKFDNLPCINIAMKKNEEILKLKKLKADLLDYSIDRIEDNTKVPFCEIIFLNSQKV